MNRRARVQWPQYTDEDWKNLGYCDRPPKYPDLTCNVHPIFAKFLDNGIRRFDGTDEEYEKILPALQLATNYLYSPSARKYIYSIVYGDRRTVSVEGFGSVEEFDEIDPSLYSSERMDRIWNQTADHHRFGPCSFQIGSVLAATYDIRGDGPDLKGTGCHGRATIIAFNPGWIVDINRLHASGRAQSMEMICIQFHLAMTFCHEVAHAVGLANQPKPFEAGLALPEPFFKDEVGAELGFSFVNEILGGTLNGWNFGHRGNILTINDWPDGFVSSTVAYPYRGPKGYPLEKFLVDMKFVQKLFKQEFWDSLAKLPTDEEKSRQLRMPKTVGWVFERHTARFLELCSKEERAAIKERESRRIVREPKADSRATGA